MNEEDAAATSQTPIEPRARSVIDVAGYSAQTYLPCYCWLNHQFYGQFFIERDGGGVS